MEWINSFISYVFTPFPGRNFSYYMTVLLVILILLGLSVYIRIKSKKNKDDKAFKKIIRPYKNKLDTLSGLLIAYLVCRYYSIPFLSMRFLLYVLLGITLVALYFLIKKYRKDYPALKKHRKEQLEKNKYIPRKRKK